MRRQLLPALRILLVLTVLCGVAYPLLVTGFAQVAFADKADGSLVHDAGGTVVGSSLIGQDFEGDQWFHGRPSSAGAGYDATASSSSNLGPTNPELLKAVAARVVAYRHENGLATDAEVPVDAVTGSGSGLDPQISVANARLQAPRVAKARNLPVAEVLALIERHTAGRSLGFLGEPGVNVVTLDLALPA
ncbi:K(+)-transporting ATPase subunit C [Aquihabitans sp. McL0605]|uniref:K(+)-transporting ATPase subunit C n=1 Tax=Aquihabitans sp. McL0605 TaxID=3415671 RepID=UPI003CEE2A57